MKTQWIRSIGCILAVLILSGIMPLAAQDNAERYTTISGVVKDKLNKKKLEYVNVSIPGSSVGTVTNADGEFTLKIPESVQAKDIEASHVGYLNSRIPLKEENPTERIVWLTPYANLLSEILVRARDPRSIVEEALRKIPANYSPQSNMLTGFYRELAQKGRRYINISEAVIDIYKTPYNETVEHDRVQIYRGRRLLSQKQSDTLAVKLLGGPNMAIYMDIVKNPDCLLAQEDLLFYEFRMEDPTSIDDRSQYVISFRPIVDFSKNQLIFRQVSVPFDYLQGNIKQLHLERNIRLVAFGDNPFLTIHFHYFVRRKLFHIHERQGGKTGEYE
jgi:hypothetical protein